MSIFNEKVTVEIQKLANLGSYFIYDLDNLKLHATKLMSGEAKLFFACKANPLSSVLSTLNETGFRFDVASNGELNQVLNIGVTGANIIMTGPAKSAELFQLALENKVGTFVIESLNQLETLEKLAPKYDYKPNILLRLQLEWDSKEESVLGGNKITPFGMDLATAREALSRMTLPFLGFHVFQWGNILSAEKLGSIWQRTIEICKTLRQDFKVLDVGGGLGIPYNGATNLELAWEEVDQLIKSFKQQHNLAEFWFELGRYLTGPYGYYVSKVIDRKNTYGRETLVLAGGINHIARPALVNEAFPAELLRKSQVNCSNFFIHGPLCTSLDFLGEYQLPNDIQVGDVIIFKQAGAYGFSESMPFFLCHDLAGEAVVREGNLSVVRESQPAAVWLK